MGSVKRAFDLTGRTALITGGSRGLGLQIAEALGEQGARIVLSSRRGPDLEQAQQHLAAQGIKAEWVAADNSKDEDIKKLADEALSKLGKVDYSRQQRRCHVGRANGGSSHRGLGQGDEPEHPFAVPSQSANWQALDDTEQLGQDYQCCLDRWVTRKYRRHPDDRLQHEQGRGGQFRARPGRQLGTLRHHRQRNRPGFLSI